MRTLTALSLSPLAMLLALSSPAQLSGQCAVAKISENVSNDIDEFGWRLAHDCGLLAVGELGADLSGSVHLFDVGSLSPLGRWTERDEVTPSDGYAGQQFSSALALSGGTLVVGTPLDNEHGSGTGAVYVFERDDAGTPGNPSDDSWVETAKIHPLDNPPFLFGTSVDIVGDTLVVGAPGSFTPFSAVYVFGRDDGGSATPLDDTWVQIARLIPDGLSTSSNLGVSVSLSADQALVLAGDPSETAAAGPTGAGVLFGRSDTGVLGDPLDDTWLPAGKLKVDGSVNPGTPVAQSVVLGADSAFVGAPFAGGDYGGRVYSFDRDDQGTADPFDDVFTYGQELSSGQGFIHAAFGETLALDGDRLAVPQRLWQFPPNKGTNIVVFERVAGVWNLEVIVEAPDPQVVEGLGDSVALAGSVLIGGASGAEYIDDWSPADGAVYAWDLDRPAAWLSDSFFLGGDSPVLAAWGSLEAGSRFGVRNYDLFHSVNAWFVLGLNRIDLPFKDGILAPSADMLLGPVSSDTFGSVTLAGFWPANVPPGTNFWVQSWDFSTSFPSSNDWRGSQAIMGTTP